MGYFDLNIPYLDSSSDKNGHQKTARIKLTTKAMELGYTGIAYNRTIKGIMSDHDRCSIPRLTLSSLLKIAPSLSASVNFHREILGVPLSSPFRQYTRLTVCVDNMTQGQALNSGNPVLKTYDIVAVRPLNQMAFDNACQRAEVDLISIEFSDKLPFRMKLPMIKAAIERGVYFEITYSNLIGDAQVRRQVISNAKLLVDWTRGKNLIFSSAAPSVTELRGPISAANLSYLLGLSTERAKAAVSKNCRTLIANALKKKLYKEAIKVELATPVEQLDPEQAWPGDWLKWDAISSGEGDLNLDDIAKAFSATNKVTKTVKAIDFTSVVDNMPSHGFQVQSLISATVNEPQLPPNGKIKSSFTEMSNVLFSTDVIPEVDQSSSDATPFNHQAPNNDDSKSFSFSSDDAKQGLEVKCLISGVEDVPQEPANGKNKSSASQMSDVLFASARLPENTSRVDVIPDIDQTSPDVTPFNDQAFNKDDSSSLFLSSDNAKPMIDCNGETKSQADTNKEDLVASQNCVSRPEFVVESQNEKVVSHTFSEDVDLDMACNANAVTEVSIVTQDISQTSHTVECSRPSNIPDAVLDASDENIDRSIMDVTMTDADTSLFMNDTPLYDCNLGKGDNAVFVDRINCLNSSMEMEVDIAMPVSNHEVPKEAMVECQEQEAAYSKIKLPCVYDDLNTQENVIEEPSTNPVEDTIEPDQEPCTELVENTVEPHQEPCTEPAEDVTVEPDLDLSLESFDAIKNKTDSLVAHYNGAVEVRMEKQEDREANSSICNPTVAQSIPGKSRARRRSVHQMHLHPFKHFLKSPFFKKKSKKFRRQGLVS